MKTKSKKILSLLIVMFTFVTLMMSQFTVFAEDTTTAEDVEGSPTFALYTNTSYTVKAGVKTTLSIPVKNTSDYTCRKINAVISEVVAAEKSSVFNFESNTYISSRRVKSGNTTTLEYVVTASEYATAGRYTFNLNLTNTNLEDVSSSNDVLTININLQSDVKSAGLEVTEFSTDKADVKPGDAFTLNVKVKNNTGVKLTDVVIALGNDANKLDGTKFAMNAGLSSYTVDINKDAEITLQYPLIACDGIASVREVIPIKLTYKINPNDESTKQEITTDATISCTVVKKPETTTPKVFAPGIIIEKYTYGGDYVVGGKTFPLSVTIKNTSSTGVIQNLKVTVQGVAGTGTDTSIAYTPANATNSFFFDKLGANATQDINIDFIAKADAIPNSYPIQLVFDYEYVVDGAKDKTDPAVTQTISIPLQQDDRFEVGTPEIEAQSYVAQECPVNITFVNKGKSIVYNVSVKVEGEGFDKTEASYYIGNVESGKEEYYDTKITPNTEGEIKGELVVTYEDSNGTQKEIRKEFITNAMQMMMDDSMMGGMMSDEGMPVDGEMEEPQGNSHLILIICIVGGVVVLGVVAFIVIRKIKKKKKLKAQEIEDEDEDI